MLYLPGGDPNSRPRFVSGAGIESFVKVSYLMDKKSIYCPFYQSQCRGSPMLFPRAIRQLEGLGERVRLARLRRQYSATTVASRASITRSTLYRVEAGDPGVSIGTCASVLRVLGLQADLDAVAKDDALGRKLQDMELPIRRVAPRRKRFAGAGKPAGTTSNKSIDYEK